MSEPSKQPTRIRIITVHFVALLLGLVGTALTIVQGRYWLAQPADSRVLVLIACVPLIAAIAFAVAPRHVQEDHSAFRPLHSRGVWANLLAPVILTLLALVLAAFGGHFEHVAGFAMLVPANAGRNLRDLVYHWRMRTFH